MIAAHAYAQIVDRLTHQNLPAYVTYSDATHIHGLPSFASGDDNGTHRIVVDVRNKRIISGAAYQTHIYENEGDSNPVYNPAFNPACYRATAQTRATWDGKPAIALDLTSACGSHDNNPFTTLYVDPTLRRPLAATGNINADEDGSGAKVYLEQDYATFGNYVLPSRLHVDVDGRGIVFWLHIHADAVYSNFTFSKRQSK